jgi:ubiquinone/menaquinone biosynthesis C-methylase UbiE
MKNMDEHFLRIADKFNDIRTTDHEPIEHIRDLLSKYERCVAVDIGCGAGRYALLLLQMMPQLHLTCLDRSSSMIAETTRLLHDANIDRFEAATADASEFPLDSDSVDVVFTFNALHHFVIPAFLREARRVLKKEGMIVIYTRLLFQNEASIWGKYFPDFNTVERRLFSLNSIEAAIRSIPGLALDTMKLFRFDRVSSLERLVDKARAGHYSTFSLYKKDRLEECIAEFRANILRNFSDADQIRWTDGNVLLTVKACEARPITDGRTFLAMHGLVENDTNEA